MKVLRSGIQTSQVDCPRCNALLQFTTVEVHATRVTSTCRWQYFIICPECDTTIDVEKNLTEAALQKIAVKYR